MLSASAASNSSLDWERSSRATCFVSCLTISVRGGVRDTVVNCRDIDESVAFYEQLWFEVLHDRRAGTEPGNATVRATARLQLNSVRCSKRTYAIAALTV